MRRLLLIVLLLWLYCTVQRTAEALAFWSAHGPGMCEVPRGKGLRYFGPHTLRSFSRMSKLLRCGVPDFNRHTRIFIYEARQPKHSFLSDLSLSALWLGVH